jgi:Putative transposase/Transposase zinc-binding domain
VRPCGALHFAYHSCRDRHCPTCGGLDQALWAEAQTNQLLPVSYFHFVFTVPATLRPFFAGPQRRHALDPLFATSSTLREVGETNLGARLGMLAVLHTWTQKLDHIHPHLHCLVPGGGLAHHGWVDRPRSLLPTRKLAPVFSAKMREQLAALVAAGTLTAGPYSSRTLLQAAAQADWVVYAKRPLAGAEQVIAYFARYTRRIAISNRRLIAYDGKRVSFPWRDREHGHRKRTRTVTGPTFCRLFLQHVLPPGFVRIRPYGILSHRLRKQALTSSRQALGQSPPPPSRPKETRPQACFRLFGVNPTICPTCGKGKLVPRWEWPSTRLPLAAFLTAAARAP